MDRQMARSGLAPRSANQAHGQGHDRPRVGTASPSAAAAATAEAASMGQVTIPSSRPSSSSSGPFASSGVLDHRLAPRPRRSWDAAFLTNAGDNGTDSAAASRPDPDGRMPGSVAAGVGGKAGAGAAAAEATAAGAVAVGASSGPAGFGPAAATQGLTQGRGNMTRSTEVEDISYRRDSVASASGGGGIPSNWGGRIGLPGTNPHLPDTTPSPTLSSSRTGTATASDDDLTDTDESVLARLAEFTEMARRTASHNEELSRELAAEKKRGAHTNRKLEQSNLTSAELTESLALAQDTVMKLREHEMAWAESTASEMSLRAEMCALKDEYANASANASALRKRCDVLQRENAELGERFATIADEKRQVESRARRLLRSDRYRGY